MKIFNLVFLLQTTYVKRTQTLKQESDYHISTVVVLTLKSIKKKTSFDYCFYCFLLVFVIQTIYHLERHDQDIMGRSHDFLLLI